MSIEKLPVRDEFTPADLLYYRRFGYEAPGAVEDMLDRNHGLADDGVFAALGRVVEVEVVTPRTTPAVIQRVTRLWD